MRRRVGALAAVSFVVCGFLLAVGLGVLVLAFVVGVVASIGVVALLTLRDRARTTTVGSIRRVRASARAVAASSAPLRQRARGSVTGATTSVLTRGSAFARAAVEGSARASREAARAAQSRSGTFVSARERVSALAVEAALTARATAIRFAPGPARTDPQREARQLNAAGTQHRREQRFDEAVDCHRRALDLLRGLDDRRGVALTQSNLALALSHSGDDDWAVGLFEEAAATLRELGDEEHEAQIMANLGLAHRRHGRREEGDNVLELALAKLDPASSAYHAIETQLQRAS